MRLCALLLLLASVFAGPAPAAGWRPAANATEVALWPDGMSLTQPEITGPENLRQGGSIENVVLPTLSIYPPVGANTGAAVVVFPGGGYQVLAIGLEGTDICDWITAHGMTCALLKYRVPGSGPNWNRSCNCRRIPAVPMALQDAQRALGLLRQRAAGLSIDPQRIGVIGFSAGGHLVAATSNATTRTYARIDAADDLSARPDFALALYPGHLWARADAVPRNAPTPDLTLAPDIRVSANTPPTFILQAQNDPVDDVRHSLAYYLALRDAGVAAELHLFAQGGHAFGLRPTSLPVGHWPELATRWLQSIGMLALDQPK